MQSIKDTYQRITDAIIEQLEAGTKPWIRPWRGNSHGSLVPRRATGEAYRGINVLMLWLASELAGYEENTWMTYRQAQDLGGQVRKGEKGSRVVKYGTFTPKEREDDDERAIPYLKGYTVFNIEQIENLPDRFYRPAEELPAMPVPHLETVETFAATPARRSPTAEQPPAIVPPPTISSCPIGHASSTRFTSTRPCFTKCRIMPYAGLCRMAKFGGCCACFWPCGSSA